MAYIDPVMAMTACNMAMYDQEQKKKEINTPPIKDPVDDFDKWQETFKKYAERRMK